VARALRDSPELGFDLLLDVTCVDYFGQPDGFQNAPETWDRNHNLVRKRAEWRHRVNLPARGDEPRFAMVYHFVSTRLLHRLRVKCRVPGDQPAIASLSALWPGANWLERETFDLYGIRFEGHPDLRRIYLYDEFIGHPLRKDYAKHDEQPIEPYAGPGAQEPRRPH
jgi:NADH-quinone oxidoreductase subunit C